MPGPYWSEEEKRRWLEGAPPDEEAPTRTWWERVKNPLNRPAPEPVIDPTTGQQVLNALLSGIGGHYPGMAPDVAAGMAGGVALGGGLRAGVQGIRPGAVGAVGARAAEQAAARAAEQEAQAAAQAAERVRAQAAARAAFAPKPVGVPKAVDVGNELLARVVRGGVALENARYPDAVAQAETELAAAKTAYKDFLETGKASPYFTPDMPGFPLRNKVFTPAVAGQRGPTSAVPFQGVPLPPSPAPVAPSMQAFPALAGSRRFARLAPEGFNPRLEDFLPDPMSMAEFPALAQSREFARVAPEGFNPALREFVDYPGLAASRRFAPLAPQSVEGLLRGERGEVHFPIEEVGRGARRVLEEVVPGFKPKPFIDTTVPTLTAEGQILRVPRDPAVAKIAEGLAVAKRVRVNRGEFEVARAEDISRKVAMAAEREAQASGVEKIPYITSALGGQGPVARYFAPPGQLELTGEEVTHVIDNIIGKNPTLQLFDRLAAYRGLNKLALGDVPTNSEIDVLGKALGLDIAESLRRLRGFDAKAREGILDALGLPKAIKSAYDFSAPLRQGLFLTVRHPLIGAEEFVRMFKHFASEEGSLELQRVIQADPLTAEIERVRPHTFTAPAGHVHAEREEAFSLVTDLAQKWVPGLRMSERAYTGYLNGLRFGVIKAAVKNADAAGEPLGALASQNILKTLPDVTPARLATVQGIGRQRELGELVDAVMTLSGRGPRVPGLPAEWLNVAFWSPRLLTSRFDTVVRLGKALGEYGTAGVLRLQGKEAHISAATKEVAQDVAATVGLGMSLLALMKGTGVAEVELDPRSPDFGRGRVGKTRFDFWGGFQQIARYTAQIGSGQAKAVGTDLMRDTGHLEPMSRFLRGKLSPTGAVPIDMLSGTTFTGDPASPERLLWNAFVPLFISDVRDAVVEDGAKAGFMTVPGAFGVGVQTFNTKEDMTQLFAPGVRYRDIASPTLRQQIDMAWRVYRLSNSEVQDIKDAMEGKKLLRRMNRGQSPADMEVNRERVRDYLNSRRTAGNE